MQRGDWSGMKRFARRAEWPKDLPNSDEIFLLAESIELLE